MSDTKHTGATPIEGRSNHRNISDRSTFTTAQRHEHGDGAAAEQQPIAKDTEMKGKSEGARTILSLVVRPDSKKPANDCDSAKRASHEACVCLHRTCAHARNIRFASGQNLRTFSLFSGSIDLIRWYTPRGLS